MDSRGLIPSATLAGQPFMPPGVAATRTHTGRCVMEEWRVAVGYSSYWVSSEGRVKSNFGRRTDPIVLRPARDTRGYLCVSLSGESGRKTRKIHQLVLEAFVGPRGSMQCTRHLNGDKQDNRLSNLRWGTIKENSADDIRHGRQPYLLHAMKTHCPAGHEYNRENTRRHSPDLNHSNGYRICRVCKRLADRDYRKRKRIEAATPPAVDRNEKENT